MNKIIAATLIFLSPFTLTAQTPKPVPKPVAKPVQVLKTNADSVSYVLGEMVAFSLLEKRLGAAKITNTNAFMKGISDVLDKKNLLIDDATANALLNVYMSKLEADIVKPTIDESNQFLAQNKLKPGVKTTASGLQYLVIKEGTGIKPNRSDSFVCHYRGTLLNGTEFDASYNRNQPLKMPVAQVIQGWIEGLQLMSVGSKYKFWIPYNLGYGTSGQGKIPGGALLIFEIDLIDVLKVR